jgi:hypothetical protein
MAQTGFTPIISYHSTTPAAVPTALNLNNGELAINIADEKLYFKNASGVVKLLADASVSAPVTSISFGSTGLTPSTGTSGNVTVSGTLITSNGGTGLSSYTAGDIVYYAAGTALSKLPIGANTTIMTSSGTAPQWTAASSVSVGTATTATNVAGGSAGAIVYQTGAGATTTLALGTSGYLLRAGASAPEYVQTVPVANGGTGQTSYVNGELLIGNTTGNTLTKSTLTAGTGISVTNGTGSITIGNTGVTAYPGAGIAVSTGSAWTTSLTAPSGTIVGTTDTQTLTNKTITQRVNSTTSISSPLAWDSDDYDMYAATAQAGDLTISADSGAPSNGQKMIFRFTCDGTARTITFTGAASKAFKPVGANLTASGSDFTYALTINKTTYFGCVYNTASSRWEVVALSQEA